MLADQHVKASDFDIAVRLEPVLTQEPQRDQGRLR